MKKILRNALLVLVSSVLLFTCVSTNNLEQSISKFYPKDIINGTTKNGTTYYIYDKKFDPAKDKNNTIEIGLIVKAGSVLEEDNQLGLAHFVEHMAFNGTTKYPGNTLEETMGKRSVRREDFNAYTTFDHTMFYMVLPNNEENLKLALDVVREWSTNLTYEDEAIAKEKPVVLEEVRARQNKKSQLYEENYKFTLGNSKYALRFPSGKMDVIDKAPREVIKKFYDDWYKPNLMAVYVLGDINTNLAESEINNIFTFDADNAQLPTIEIPLGTPNTLVTKQTADETLDNTVIMSYKIPKKILKTVQDQVDELTAYIAIDIIDKQLKTLMDAGIIRSIDAYKYDFAIGYEEFDVYFEVLEDKYQEGMSEVFKSIAAIKNIPVKESDITQSYDQMYQQLTDKSIDYSSNYFIMNFINNATLIDKNKITYFLDLLKSYLTPQIIQAKINSFFTQSELRMIMLANKDGILPSQDKVQTMFNDILLSKNAKLAEANNIDEINKKIDKALESVKPGNIVTQKKRANYGTVYDFELANGIKVEYYKNSIYDKSFKIFLHSVGGNRAVLKKKDVGDYVVSQYMNIFMKNRLRMGMKTSEFIDYFNANKISQSYFDIASNNKTVVFAGDISKVEPIFKMLYLFFEPISQDTTQTNSIISNVQQNIKEITTTPNAYFFLSFLSNFYIDDPYEMFNKQFDYVVSQKDIDRAFEIYNIMFSAPQNFKFSIYGNESLSSVKKYIAKYIASMPTKQATSLEIVPYVLNNTFDKTITFKDTDQALVFYGWVNKIPPNDISEREFLLMKYLETLLNTKLTDNIREKEAGVYYINTDIYYEPVISNPYVKNTDSPINISLGIVFGSEPSRAQELKEKSIKILEELRDKPIDADILARSKASVNRWIDERRFYDVGNKNFYLRIFVSTVLERPNIRKDLKKIFDTITVEDLQQFLATYTLDATNISYMLFPEKFTKSKQ